MWVDWANILLSRRRSADAVGVLRAGSAYAKGCQTGFARSMRKIGAGICGDDGERCQPEESCSCTPRRRKPPPPAHRPSPPFGTVPAGGRYPLQGRLAWGGWQALRRWRGPCLRGRRVIRAVGLVGLLGFAGCHKGRIPSPARLARQAFCLLILIWLGVAVGMGRNAPADEDKSEIQHRSVKQRE